MQAARDEFSLSLNLGGAAEPGYWSEYLDQADIETFHQQAYANADGLAIRINPVTGYKELYVSGSRGVRDHIQNLAEGLSRGIDDYDEWLEAYGAGKKAETLWTETGWGKARAADPMDQQAFEWAKTALSGSELARDYWTQYIDTVIEAEGVEVVYGHSRGAATISGLKSNVKKIGLDGAMYIAKEDTEFTNLANANLLIPQLPGVVDYAISGGYKHNVYLPNRAFHDVARGKDVEKKPKPTGEASAAQRKKQRRQRPRAQKSRERVKELDKLLGRKTDDQKKAQYLRNRRKYFKWKKHYKDAKRLGKIVYESYKKHQELKSGVYRRRR